MRAFQITTHCLDTTSVEEGTEEKVNLDGLEWMVMVGIVSQYVGVDLVESIDKGLIFGLDTTTNR